MLQRADAASPLCMRADPYTPDVLAITGLLREDAGAPAAGHKKEALLQQLPEASPFRNISSALA